MENAKDVEKSLFITIPIETYEQLLMLKTRVDVAVERMWHDQYIKTEDILWILGTELAVDVAEEINRKKEEAYKVLTESAIRAEVSE